MQEREGVFNEVCHTIHHSLNDPQFICRRACCKSDTHTHTYTPSHSEMESALVSSTDKQLPKSLILMEKGLHIHKISLSLSVCLSVSSLTSAELPES